MGDALTKFALPSDDYYQTATLSMTNADSAYPVANSQGQDPSLTTKATTTSTVVQVDLTSSQRIYMFAVFNTNATTIRLKNDGTFNQLMTVPARSSSGQINAGWLDMELLSLTTHQNWEIEMSKTGSAVLEFGRVCLVNAKRDLEWKWDGKRGVEWPGNLRKETALGTQLRYYSRVRRYIFSGPADRDTMLATARELEDQVNGAGLGFLLIPNFQVNEASFCTFQKDEMEWTFKAPGTSSFELDFIELSKGRPPAST